MSGGGRSGKYPLAPAAVSQQKQKQRPALTAEEQALFRTAVADAQPLISDRIHHERSPPPAIPRQREQDEAAALDESLHGPLLSDLFLEGGDEAAWRRDGLSLRVLRDLRRGRWVVQASLDLHGHTRDEARAALATFLAECQAGAQRCIRIVHGKGQHSPGREPVLKHLVLGWLSRRREVLAFCQARPIDGGAGAVIVLLQVAR
ncbi:Smr/MutS family protein [Rugosibacter aromaticivorans]|uniref:Smr/MutS family protein n=1 Tax=Rugosibacter aromaticivorans TaxID=1565605 RepID=UPI0012153518|nr:Smr/MutS family protein [Rugosibacter aromaticivorans]TBR15580.1 MAG: DNA mismatch repair protein MutS [Rugosibacter sp.]